MHQILLIARKDLRSYFHSPIAYVVTATFLLLVGWMFSNLFSYFAQALNQYAAVNFGEKPTLDDGVIRPLFGNINVILLFVAPFVTMRLVAEEKKDHTIQLLLTAPLRAVHIVFGKFLAGWAFLLVMIALTLVYPVLLQFTAHPDWGLIGANYLGVVLMAATYVAIGLFWSSCTENQIVSAMLTFGTLLFFWLVSWSAHRAGTFWAEILNYLSLSMHFSSFSQGAVDTTDVIYYLTVAGFGLFLTNLSLDSN